MNDPIVKIVPTKSDVEIAAELKQKIGMKLEELVAVLNEAVDAGFHVQYATGASPLGRQIVTALIIAKHY